jgi:hypothetical protein
VTDATLTGGGEDGTGAAAMLLVVARSGTGSWTRRQGVRWGSATFKKEGQRGGREKSGAER